MLQVTTEWTGPQGSGLRSIMTFDGDTAGDAQVASDAVRALWIDLKAYLSSQYTIAMSPEVRYIVAGTGELTDILPVVPGTSMTGESPGEPVPDATQVLLRWQTGSVVDGRSLRGRQFIPGLVSGSVDNGNLNAGILAGFQTDIDAWLGNQDGFSVWHRPLYGPVSAGRPLLRPGVIRPVIAGSVWSELAVQRRRRG